MNTMVRNIIIIIFIVSILGGSLALYNQNRSIAELRQEIADIHKKFINRQDNAQLDAEKEIIGNTESSENFNVSVNNTVTASDQESNNTNNHNEENIRYEREIMANLITKGDTIEGGIKEVASEFIIVEAEVIDSLKFNKEEYIANGNIPTKTQNYKVLIDGNTIFNKKELKDLKANDLVRASSISSVYNTNEFKAISIFYTTSLKPE